MDFSQEDKDCLHKNLSLISNDYKALLGNDLSSIKEIETLLVDQDAISNTILKGNNGHFLKKENARIIVFYSFLKMIGRNRLTELNYVLISKEAGLKLGLNSIGVAQLVFKIRRYGFSVMNVAEVVKLFKVNNN